MLKAGGLYVLNQFRHVYESKGTGVLDDEVVVGLLLKGDVFVLTEPASNNWLRVFSKAGVGWIYRFAADSFKELNDGP
jgi:hypothetical protein